MSLWQKVCFLIAIVLQTSSCIQYIYVRVWGAIDSATQAAAESSLTFPPDISIVSLVASHVFPCDARALREKNQKDTFIKSACVSIIVNKSTMDTPMSIISWHDTKNVLFGVIDHYYELNHPQSCQLWKWLQFFHGLLVASLFPPSHVPWARDTSSMSQSTLSWR